MVNDFILMNIRFHIIIFYLSFELLFWFIVYNMQMVFAKWVLLGVGWWLGCHAKVGLRICKDGTMGEGVGERSCVY